MTACAVTARSLWLAARCCGRIGDNVWEGVAASATFAREATLFISAKLRSTDWERKTFACSRFFGHDIDEATDKSHTNI